MSQLWHGQIHSEENPLARHNSMVGSSELFTNSEADFERLELLFRRASSLPELPGSALRIIHAIDTGAASAIDLEKIISADPGLSGNLLRVSNARVPGVENPQISTIRAAIMRLGQRSVRTLAVSLILHNVSHGRDVASEFHVDRFARHSLFVAFLGRYLFARRNLSKAFESRWSADEIFAGGLLHDIGMALLARVSPECFFRVYSFASRTSIPLELAFSKIFQRSITELARTAVQSWTLPQLFATTLTYMPEPWMNDSEYTALCCLNYANHLALVNGITTEDWKCEVKLMPEVEAEISLPAEEAEKVVGQIDKQVNEYMNAGDSIAA